MNTGEDLGFWLQFICQKITRAPEKLNQIYFVVCTGRQASTKTQLRSSLMYVSQYMLSKSRQTEYAF